MTEVRNPNWEAELGALEPGWDSYCGKPIDRRAIAAMKALLAETPTVVPRSGGGLDLEWSDYCLSITADGRNEVDTE